MAAHVPAQPTNVALVGGVTKSFVTAMQAADRSFTPELIEKYGNENYVFLLDMLGAKLKTENVEYYHYEKRRSQSAMQVASISPASPGAGVDVTVTFAAGSHSDSGTKSPIRAEEVVQISASGILGKVISVSTTTPSAHTAVVRPIKAAEAFAPAANDYLFLLGAWHVGENSDKISSRMPIVDKVFNYCTEIRDDFQITDKAAMERIEYSVDGQQNYRYIGTSEMEKRWLNTQEYLTVFSGLITNTNITNGSKGTKGLIDQVVGGGSDLAYTAGSMGVTNFQAVTRELTFNGAGAELHHLADMYQFQEIQRTLFALYPNGAVQWGSVGGSAEVAAKYGFNSFTIDGFTFHFKKYAPFSPEWTFGVSPATAPNYRNYGLIIPQGFATQLNGTKLPAICLRYQEIPNAGEISAYETGGLALANKTPKQELWNHMVAHRGVQVAGANQCVIFQA